MRLPEFGHGRICGGRLVTAIPTANAGRGATSGTAAGVRKPPREETAERNALVQRGLWDFAAADDVGEQWRDAAARWSVAIRLMNG
jgi:hypothetical protein